MIAEQTAARFSTHVNVDGYAIRKHGISKWAMLLIIEFVLLALYP